MTRQRETTACRVARHSGGPTIVRREAVTSPGNLPIDARIKVTGGTPPLVGFLGKSVLFTELDDVGTATFNVAPGNPIWTRMVR